MSRTIGEKIRDLRLQRKMTQDELAEKMGVSSQAVSKWEKDLSIPDLPVLIELSDFFYMPLDDLVRDKEPTVQLLPKEARRNIDDMFLRVNVHTAQGDKVKINLPLAFVRLASDMQVEIPSFKGSDILKSLDMHALIALIEGGTIGKIVEVETGDGDVVEVVVE